MSKNVISCKNKEEFESKVIDFLRFPLMIGVVIIHCRYSTILQPQLLDHVEVGGGYFYVSWFFSKVLFGLCVPAFFFISGYLFFKNGSFNIQAYFNKLKKRFYTILIPFISWNVIYVLIFLLLGYNIGYYENGDPVGIVPWLNGNTGDVCESICRWAKGIFVDFNASGSPADVLFWYLRDLICMFVLTPAIFWFVKYLRKFGLVIVVLAWVWSGRFITFPYLFLRPAVLFFIMGSYFALNKKNVIEFFMMIGRWIYWLYAVFSITDLLTTQYSYNCFIHRMTVLMGVIVAFKVAIYFVDREQYPEKGLLECVKNTNFFIFASHWILLYWLAFPLSRFYNGSDFSLVLVYFVEIILSCALAIVLGMLLNKLFPKMMRLINGR